MKKRIFALILAPILGAVLGYLVTAAMDNGWFSSQWQMVESPPGNIRHLVAVSKGSLWVESDSGILYYNENPSSCDSECWQEVSEIPHLPIIEPFEVSVSSTACAPFPPLSRVTSTISECRTQEWVDINSTFALRSDGSIYLWQVELYKEWSVVLIVFGMCVGAISLFILALVVVLINWLSNRTREKQEKKKGPLLPNTACTPSLRFGRWGIPSAHALGWAMVAADCSLAQSAAFSSIFLASSLYCSQAESTPAHLPVPRQEHAGLPTGRYATQTVGQSPA